MGGGGLLEYLVVLIKLWAIFVIFYLETLFICAPVLPKALPETKNENNEFIVFILHSLG
ncbi:MAG: hypothetical protein UR12_C0046G0002 [candidate division TM6 bacterium GW2011_GWF2_30_66]|jgi:hypothetical protein|nr:MAG: hypothetical protein UR12_C0046G0002 [candidate division TM6 bacterium GW2011_GWF2_30_66]